MRRVLLALLLAVALPLYADTRTPLSRALADALYVKLAGGSVISGTTTFTNITITGTCTGCPAAGVTGTGTTGVVPKWTSSTAIGDSAVAENSGQLTWTAPNNAAAFTVTRNTTGVGTVSITNGSKQVTGTGTSFLSQVRVGDTITVSGQSAKTVTNVFSDTVFYVSAIYGTTSSGLSYTLGAFTSAFYPNGTLSQGLQFPFAGSLANPVIRVGASNNNTGGSGWYARAGDAFDIFGSGVDLFEATSSLGFLLTSASPCIGWTGSATTGSSNRTALCENGDAATVRIGLAANATPVAQALAIGESGSGSNIAGANGTIQSGNGTGTGGSGSIIFQTAPVAGSSSTANTMATVLTLSPNGSATFAGGLTVSGTLSPSAMTAQGAININGNTLSAFQHNIVDGSSSGTDNNAGWGAGIVHNSGAVSLSTRTLPAAANGKSYRYVIDDADGIKVLSVGSDTLTVGTYVTGAAGYLQSTTLGSTLTIYALGSSWYVATMTGTWTDGTITWKSALQDPAPAFLAANGTNATSTLATTGLSITVTSGRKYSFQCTFSFSETVAADGVSIDFGGGSATSTNFRAWSKGFSPTDLIGAVTKLTALTTLHSDTSAIDTNFDIEVSGSFEPSSTGTFIPRYAQSAHTTGTVTIERGSYCKMWDMN